MDAVTTAAAALAIVVDESQQAAMQALLLERERLAMLAAHHESYMAQRHWVGTLQKWQLRPMTWQMAFTSVTTTCLTPMPLCVGRPELCAAAMPRLR